MITCSHTWFCPRVLLSCQCCMIPILVHRMLLEDRVFGHGFTTGHWRAPLWAAVCLSSSVIPPPALSPVHALVSPAHEHYIQLLLILFSDLCVGVIGFSESGLPSCASSSSPSSRKPPYERKCSWCQKPTLGKQRCPLGPFRTLHRMHGRVRASKPKH